MTACTPLEATYDVRFHETDALQHVSNTVVVKWFESGREPIFRMFTPELDLQNWPLILASYKVDFHSQMYYGSPVTIKTYVSRLGNSAFDVLQEVWQNDQRCASGVTTMVHFDHKAQKSRPIPEHAREAMMKHFKELA